MKKRTEEKSTGQKVNHNLCLQEDYFLEEKTIWIVELSDGKTVYQDDYREGCDEPIAWKRLRSHCLDTKCKINSMRIKFRSHSEYVGLGVENISGYYFSYGITKNINNSQSTEYYIAGYLANGIVVCDWYKTPEIIICDTKSRKINDKDFDNQSLIIN